MQIDCQPSHSVPSTVLVGGSKAQLIVSLLAPFTTTTDEGSFVPDDAVYTLALPITTPSHTSPSNADEREQMTVRTIIDILISEGRHNYEFDEKGVGCRYWVHGVVELLARKGVVGNGEVERAREGIGRLWPGGGQSVMDCGAFY